MINNNHIKINEIYIIDVFYVGLVRNPTSYFRGPPHAVGSLRPIGLSSPSVSQRFEVLSHEPWTNHPSPPRSPRLSKKVRRAVDAMLRSSAQVW